jgi:hypothetical protein
MLRILARWLAKRRYKYIWNMEVESATHGRYAGLFALRTRKRWQLAAQLNAEAAGRGYMGLRKGGRLTTPSGSAGSRWGGVPIGRDRSRPDRDAKDAFETRPCKSAGRMAALRGGRRHEGEKRDSFDCASRPGDRENRFPGKSKASGRSAQNDAYAGDVSRRMGGALPRSYLPGSTNRRPGSPSGGTARCAPTEEEPGPLPPPWRALTETGEKRPAGTKQRCRAEVRGATSKP